MKDQFSYSSPIQLAAERDSVEIMTLFAEYAQNPAGTKAKLLKLIIESDGQQDASLDAFKQQLESLSASEVDQIDISSDGNLLHFAVIKDLKEHVRILLEHGCDPKVPMAAYDDKSPLETAIDYGQMEIWNIMREGLEFTEKEKLEQLCRMIVAGKMEQDDPWKEFKELLSSLPVDLVNTTSVEAKGSSEEKRTLLQVSTAHDNKGAVRLLLEKGVDPKESGSYGKTAVDIATANESMEVVELLWEAIGEEIPDNVKLQQLSKAMYKEDIEEAKKKFSELLRSLSPELVSTTAVNRYGSLLQDAVFEGKTDFVRLLLDYGVDAKVATDEKDDTPIEIALERDRTEIAVLLCEAIGEEVPDKVKLQQLSKAMYKEDKEEEKKEFSEILASLPPDVVSSTAVNDYGSVLRDAVLEGKTDFIRLLLEHGVNPTVGTDNVKDTPIQLAAERDSVEIMTLFAEYAKDPAGMKA